MGSTGLALETARAVAAQVGVTRSAHITNIDRIGIPVAIAIRPGAAHGSLVVTAGKGRTSDAAETGALLESVELAAAQFDGTPVGVVATSYGEMVRANGCEPEALLDLCPLQNSRIALAEPVGGVVASTWSDRKDWLVPAELVFLPPPAFAAPRPVFGASSTGLGCGDSLAAAVRHAVLEVVERDVMSFHLLQDIAVRIGADGLRDLGLAELSDRITAADLDLTVSLLPNALGVPTAHAVIVDHEEESPTFVNGGFASAMNVGSAIERAVLEAVQSRVCFMHGGREDLPALVGASKRGSRIDTSPLMRPSDVTGMFASEEELGSLDDLVRHLEAKKVGPVTFVVLRDGSVDGVWVVRVVIPGCEAFQGRHLPRVGPRLERSVGG